MEKKKNTPKLRFPEFTEEWEEKKLGEIANISSGGTPNRSNSRYWNGNIAWITTSLINFNVIHKAEEYITDEGLQNSSAKLFPSGTLLMAMYGQGVTRGKVSILGIEASCNQACCAIVPKKNLYDKLFIFQNLFYRYDEIRNLSNQGGQQNLSGEIIKNIPIKLAAYSEQTKIATFLAAVDEKLTQLKKKKTLLEQYKKGVMQKLFSQQLRFKDDNNQDFPDWQEKTLGDVASIRSGLSKNQNGNTDGIKVTRIETISDGTINTERVGYIDMNVGLEEYKLLKGDILFSNINSVSHIGKTAIAFCDLDLYHGMNLLCIRTRKSFDSFFLFYYLNLESIRCYFKSVCNQAVSQASINQTELAKTILTTPSLSEQQKIAKLLLSIDDKIDYCGKQIVRMESWKKGLLQQMFI